MCTISSTGRLRYKFRILMDTYWLLEAYLLKMQFPMFNTTAFYCQSTYMLDLPGSYKWLYCVLVSQASAAHPGMHSPGTRKLHTKTHPDALISSNRARGEAGTIKEVRGILQGLVNENTSKRDVNCDRKDPIYLVHNLVSHYGALPGSIPITPSYHVVAGQCKEKNLPSPNTTAPSCQALQHLRSCRTIAGKPLA